MSDRTLVSARFRSCSCDSSAASDSLFACPDIDADIGVADDFPLEELNLRDVVILQFDF